MKSNVLPVFLISLLCLIHISKCLVATEDGRIQDEALLEQGYSCKSRNEAIGLMKNGEEIFTKSCTKIMCSHGMISYIGCGVVQAAEGCHIVDKDLSKNYPECCNTVKCKV